MKNHKLPRDFCRRMDQFWQQYIAQGQAVAEDIEAFYDALNQPPNTGLQYMGQVEDLPALEERLQQEMLPLPWDNGHFLLKKIPGVKSQLPGRDLFHDLGLIYIQEPAAAMPIASVDLSKAMRILDLCAAPGGKTSQIYQKMVPEATLWANDVDIKRARILQQNMLRIGAANVLVSRADAATFAQTKVTFDFILLDAPCSGEALLRRKPQIAYQWRRYPPKVIARTQRQILDDIWPQLEPGGRLLYATCTYNTIENEELIAAFVQDQADAKIIPFDHARPEGIRPGLALEDCPETKLAHRIFPHDGWGEGQFAILLEKDSHTKAPQLPPPTTDKPQNLGLANLDLASIFPGYDIQLYDERLFAVRPQEVACIQGAAGIDFLKQGIYIGKYIGGQLKPSESWASLQDPVLWPRCLDFKDQPQMLADLRSGRDLKWPIEEEGLYLLTTYGRGIGWLNIGGLDNGLLGQRSDQRITLTLTQALRST